MLKAAVADTIFSSGTWNRITNTPTIHATTNIAINTLNFYSATFTAGNIGDTCLGVFIHISNVGTGGTWTIGLQQNSITVATANTRAVSTLNGITNQWVYFAFPTPFAFTSTSAGYYRFVVTVAGSTGSNGLAADSSGTLFSYLAVDNRSAGKPVSGDDIWVGGDSAVVTLTMDGTQTVGSRAGTAQYSTRTVTHAVNICFNAKILWDTAASASLTCRGAPEDATDGNQWEFKILAKAGTQTYCAGFAKKAAGLVGKVANVKLYLPGSVAPDATTVLTDNTNWNSWMVAANYTGTLDLYATVRITIFSTVSTDYLYIDDLYNGTNKITALDTWDQGMPSPIMFEQLGDAAAVWATIEGSAVFKLLGNKVTKSGDVITIYEDDGITTWREYDLASGGRALV